MFPLFDFSNFTTLIGGTETSQKTGKSSVGSSNTGKKSKRKESLKAVLSTSNTKTTTTKPKESSKKVTTSKETVTETEIELVSARSELDVRVEKQKNRQVSYDVGVRVGGSSKDFHAALKKLKEAFQENPSIENMEAISAQDKTSAIEMARRNLIFNWFSMVNAESQGVELGAAFLLAALIRKLPVDYSKVQNNMYLEEFMYLMNFISTEMKTVRTLDEAKQLFRRIHELCTPDKEYNFFIERTEFYKDVVNNLDAKTDSEVKIMRNIWNFRYAQTSPYMMEVNTKMGLRKFKDFSEFMNDFKKRKTFFNNIDKKIVEFSSWSQYLSSLDKKDEPGSKKTNTPAVAKLVWDRELPLNPIRKNGVSVPEFNVPEEFLTYFSFRSVEMGLWMKDVDALAHLRYCGKAFADLADTLNVPTKAISLGGQLAMAFGARGKSKAAAHYERGFNVINLTKTKGWLGTLAHEFMHAMDYFLANKLTKNSNSKLLSEMLDDGGVPSDVYLMLSNLMKAIKEGECTDYVGIDITKKYRPNSKSIALYNEFNGDLQAFVDTRIKELDESYERARGYYHNEESLNKVVKKQERQRPKKIKEFAEVAAQIHREQTGEVVTEVPFTVYESKFYNMAKKLDGNKSKKYWSTECELLARAFEAHVMYTMGIKDMQNDYLVFGLDPIAYPKGKELKEISLAMQQFLNVVLPFVIDSAPK